MPMSVSGRWLHTRNKKYVMVDYTIIKVKRIIQLLNLNKQKWAIGQGLKMIVKLCCKVWNSS